VSVLDRRESTIGAAALFFSQCLGVHGAQAEDGAAHGRLHQNFIDEAERMRRQAVASGDQSYGAVVVYAGEIIGWGPSRVIVDRNLDAHAERVAIRDAQSKTGNNELAGAVLYSTSRACPVCEAAAARARISRMFWGAKGADAGHPRG